jgi:predicted naringenin-chalcone synthase
MTIGILGMGSALPRSLITLEEGLRLAQRICKDEALHKWLPGIYSGAGIRTRRFCLPRHIVDEVLAGVSASDSPFVPTPQADARGPSTGERMRAYAEHAPPLAHAASAAAMADAKIAPGEVTHVVTVSCTGFIAPGIAERLIASLHLNPSVERTHVGYMGCHGAFNGLRVAHAFAACNPSARVLVCSTELCSLHYDYGADPQRLIANAIFADGAGALVVASGGSPRIEASASRVFPDTADAMSWTIGDHGFQMNLSRRIPELIATHLRPWLSGWLEQQEVSIAEIGSWAIHPGGPRILAAVQESLGLGDNALADSRAIYAECGNMSSATVLFILEHLQRRRADLPWVALGFGPGLAVEASLFR